MALSVEIETKICKTCCERLPLNKFDKAPAYKGKQYYRGVCKNCNSISRGKIPGKRGSVVNGMKPCTECHEVKPVNEFYLQSSGYPAGNCKVCTLRKQAERYQEDPEFRAKKIKYAHEYFEENYAQQRANSAVNAICNRIRYSEYSARYRARKILADVGNVDYNEIIARDKGVCHICNESVLADDISFDHVQPLSKGGAHSMDNLKLAHLLCNICKNARWEGVVQNGSLS